MPFPEATQYVAWLRYDYLDQVVLIGTTDGTKSPVWKFGEVVPDSQKARVMQVLHKCWQEIGGHVGGNTVADMVTALELVSLELAFPLVLPGETLAALGMSAATHPEYAA